MKASVILHALDLVDSRHGRESGITKVITPAVGSAADATDMIRVKFDQDEKLNKDADVKVIGIYIVVCPEYLVRLSDFFVKGMPEAPKQVEPVRQTPAVTASQEAPGLLDYCIMSQ